MLRNPKGLTYIEVTVAIALLSIAIVMASPLLLRYKAYREGIFVRYRSLYALEGEINYLKSLPIMRRPCSYAGRFLGGDGGLTGIPKGVSRTIIESTDIDGLSKIKVSVTWVFSGKKYLLSRELLMRTRYDHAPFH